MTSISLITFWILFGLGHSILASQSVKRKLQSSGMQASRYRFIYNFVAIFCLLPIVWIHWFDQSISLFSLPFGFKFLSGLFAIKGLFITAFAFKNYDLRSFLGLKEEESKPILNTSGMNEIMRHPLYTGTMMIAVGICFLKPQLNIFISAFCVILYIAIGTMFEERKLIAQFGEEYNEYKKKVPRFIPIPGDLIGWIFRSRKP